MKFLINIFLICFLASFLFTAQAVYAVISISVTGSWVEIIDKNDLSSGVGSNLQSTYTSISGQVTIDVSGTSDVSDAWRVDVKKIDSSWSNELHPSVMRTSDGTGGSVSGGGSYQEVTNTNASFFSGSGDVTGIKVRFKMTGASVAITPASYSTNIYYTIVDI